MLLHAEQENTEGDIVKLGPFKDLYENMAIKFLERAKVISTELRHNVT